MGEGYHQHSPQRVRRSEVLGPGYLEGWEKRGGGEGRAFTS